MSFLYVLIMGTSMSSSDLKTRYQFNSMNECLTAAKATRIEKSADQSVIVFCANDENQRHYNATWWIDPVKDAK